MDDTTKDKNNVIDLNEKRRKRGKTEYFPPPVAVVRSISLLKLVEDMDRLKELVSDLHLESRLLYSIIKENLSRGTIQLSEAQRASKYLQDLLFPRRTPPSSGP